MSASVGGWSRRRTTAQALALRSRIVLAAAEGAVELWRSPSAWGLAPDGHEVAQPLRRARLEGLLDEPRPGRPRTVTDEQVERIVTTRWRASPSTRRIGRRGRWRRIWVSPQDAVWRTWQAFGLQPHRQEKFKLSTDPQFIEKVYDICGLYLNPPERAVVLCVDEKSQIQALDRTQPILPMLPGTPERATHDYKRHGTSSLYAALDLATGKVIGSLHERHRAIEFHKFLQTIDREVPATSTCTSCSTTARPTRRRRSSGGSRPPTLPPALHPDLQQLDQPRRTLVRRADQQAAQRAALTAPSARSTPTSAPGSRTGTRTGTPPRLGVIRGSGSLM